MTPEIWIFATLMVMFLVAGIGEGLSQWWEDHDMAKHIDSAVKLTR